MLLWTAPLKPEGFDSFVRNGRAKIAMLLRAGAIPTSEDFEPTWSDVSRKYKAVFLTRQCSRCAWCDRLLTDYGALDHLRPKASVAQLDPDNPGRELRGGVNRDPRFPRSCLNERSPGYWWLAFRWSNFVLACTQCNSGWKVAFVARRTDGERSFLNACPSRSASEGWLVLHPYAADRASRHFFFHDSGAIEGLTDEGRATIAVVALDRDSLRSARKGVVEDVLRLVDRFSDYLDRWISGDEGTLPEAVQALDDLERKGRAERSLASVVRAVAERSLCESWESIELLLSELREALAEDA